MAKSQPKAGLLAWFATIPGCITAIATLLAAVTALIVALQSGTARPSSTGDSIAGTWDGRREYLDGVHPAFDKTRTVTILSPNKYRAVDTDPSGGLEPTLWNYDPSRSILKQADSRDSCTVEGDEMACKLHVNTDVVARERYTRRRAAR